jgi:hypothetical protein
MRGSDDQRAAARKDADLMISDLNRVCGLLEEVATTWRRAELYGRQSSPTAPGHLQDAARSLAALLGALPEADCGQHPALAFSAVAQLVALESDAALSAAVTVTGGSHLGDGIWAAIQDALLRVRKQLWSLISCLVKIGDTPVTEAVTAGRNSG